MRGLDNERKKKMMTTAKRLENKGRQEGRQEIAKKMLQLKQPIAIISQVTGLRPVELEKLQKIAKEKVA
jgi:predicted transposase YdaD